MPYARSLAVAALGLALTAAPAAAHSELVDSQPAAGTELAQPPALVRLMFSDELAPASTVQVLDAGFQPRTAGAPAIDPANARVITVALQPLAPGDYTVQYHAVEAADQHAVDGSFAFRVTGAGASGAAPVAAEPANETAPAAPAAQPGSLPNWVYFVTALLAVLGMFALTLRRRTAWERGGEADGMVGNTDGNMDGNTDNGTDNGTDDDTDVDGGVGGAA